VAAVVALVLGCAGGDGSSSQATPTAEPARPASPARGTQEAGARRVRLQPVGRFSSPIYVTAPREDTDRLFVVERAGRIRVLVNGRKRSAPFLDIRGLVSTGGERGLLSMAFAPDYASSGRFYVYFTDNRGDIRIEEFRRASADRAARRSRRTVLRVGHRRYSNHNGGQLQFGPDGFLYAGTGDGGGGGDPFRSGQSLRTDLGKLLRIDPRAGGGRSFRVPANNPFRGRRGARPEIWAYGLRNPWRFSFDRGAGSLVIADVGQDSQEEVDFVARGRGANFGWSVFEGRRRFRGGSARRHARPVLVKGHGSGWCSIVGGYVVRDPALPALRGRYVYGDLCRSGIRSVRLTRGRARGDRGTGLNVSSLVSFGEDAAGRLYAVSLGGRVYRFVPR
jgi:glucose/arabinose dehydrogenase